MHVNNKECQAIVDKTGSRKNVIISFDLFKALINKMTVEQKQALRDDGFDSISFAKLQVNVQTETPS